MILSDLNNSLEFIIFHTKQNINILCIILALPWIMYIISIFYKRILLFGIIPRNFIGLRGIILAPLLHANFNHIFFNSIPLLIFSNFLLMYGFNYFLYATIWLTLVSGILIWCFARPGIHIGASSIITGYWVLLVWDMSTTFNFINIVIGVVTIYYFSGIFFGILPLKKGVSWEGHLFGFIAGILWCFYII